MDEKANFETKVSIIGGTMGLFAGFSIISAVEFIFFVIKFLIITMKKFKESKNLDRKWSNPQCDFDHSCAYNPKKNTLIAASTNPKKHSLDKYLTL